MWLSKRLRTGNACVTFLSSRTTTIKSSSWLKIGLCLQSESSWQRSWTGITRCSTNTSKRTVVWFKWTPDSSSKDWKISLGIPRSNFESTPMRSARTSETTWKSFITNWSLNYLVNTKNLANTSTSWASWPKLRKSSTNLRRTRNSSMNSKFC